MATTYGFYADFGMTQPLSSLNFSRASDGSSAPEDKVFYIGTKSDNKDLYAASNPGVDSILLSIVDADGSAGLTPAMCKLAIMQEELDNAIAGAPCDLGTMGTPNGAGAYACWEIWVRITTPLLAEGSYTDLTFQTNDVIEVTE